MYATLSYYGLFYEITELSKMRIPSVSVVFGASTAGGAYQPGMSDYNIFIKNQSKVFLGGVALTKMATGEDADEEILTLEQSIERIEQRLMVMLLPSDLV